MYFQPPVVILVWSVIIPFMVVDTYAFIYSVWHIQLFGLRYTPWSGVQGVFSYF